MKYFLFAFAFLATTSQLGAEVMMQPPGLAPGDRYRLLFVTSESRDALSSNIDDYDNFVQSVADAAPVVGPWGLSWQAWASTPTVDARDHTETHPDLLDSAPVYRIDGELLSANYDGLYVFGPGATSAALNVTELGTTLPLIDDPEFDPLATPVWTGTGTAGEASCCPLGAMGNSATVGFADLFLDPALNSQSASRQNQYPLYAMSELLVAVPEPSTSTLVLASICILTLLRSSRRFC